MHAEPAKITVAPTWSFECLSGTLPVDYSALLSTLARVLTLASNLSKKLTFVAPRLGSPVVLTVTDYDEGGGHQTPGTDAEPVELRVRMYGQFCIEVPQDGTFASIAMNEEGLWLTMPLEQGEVHVCFYREN